MKLPNDYFLRKEERYPCMSTIRFITKDTDATLTEKHATLFDLPIMPSISGIIPCQFPKETNKILYYFSSNQSNDVRVHRRKLKF